MEDENACVQMELEESTNPSPYDGNPMINQNQQNEEQNNEQNNEENAAINNATDTSNDNATRRDKCAYGIDCYRKNIHHKTKYSHPGDPDYNEVDNRPECPYGLQCYRKNPQHKRDFQHIRTRPRRQNNSLDIDDIEFNISLSSEDESVDGSEYNPSDLDMSDDDVTTDEYTDANADECEEEIEI